MEVGQLSPAAVDAGWRLLDCREQDELAGGVIAGSLWVPLGEIPLRIESTIPDKNPRLLVYCESGRRSQEAARRLSALGYSNVQSLEGGIRAWRRQGFPVSVDPKGAGLSRYRSQMIMPEVGDDGQRRLAAAKVLLIGAGGLGSPVALYLAGAGVGQIGLVDHDVVEESNLHRQIVHSTAALGKPKVESAAATLKGLNPEIKIRCFDERLSAANVESILPEYDLVVDGTDNYESRYFINDACRRYGKTNVHGAVFGFQGQVAVFGTDDGDPCYRCLFPEPPPREFRANCSQDGVLGPAVGVIGCQMAIEVIKVIVGLDVALKKNLMVWDGLSNTHELLPIEKDETCAGCGAHARTEDAWRS